MADMRDALRKAGLASKKELRQVKHRDRVRRKDLGKDGLAAEREQGEAEHRAEGEDKKRADRAREKDRAQHQRDEAVRTRLASLLQENDLSSREGGPKRFYFETPDGHISFLEVSPNLVRRLAQGDAAIVSAADVLRADFIPIPGKAAHELHRLAPERILLWNARR